MAKMFVLNEADLVYLPDGIAHQQKSLIRRTPSWAMRRWLEILTMNEILIDLGTNHKWQHTGEFQMWGRRYHEDYPVVYPHEVWREWTDPKGRGRVLRYCWELTARKAEKRFS